MKKIKDIIYDFNDVLVALLIIAIAGGVIYWRVNTVMAYPKYLADKQLASQSPDIDFSDVDLHPEEIDDIQTPGVDPGSEDDIGEDTPGEDNPGESTPGEDNPGESKPPEQNPSGYTEVEFEVKKGAVWGTIASELKAQGLIADTKSFTARVSERKLEMKLQIGKFKLNSIMTVDEIIDTLVK